MLIVYEINVENGAAKLARQQRVWHIDFNNSWFNEETNIIPALSVKF